MLSDRPEAREECLRAFRVRKAAHAALAFACRLVAVLGTIVEPGCRFDEHVLVRLAGRVSFCFTGANMA